MQTYTITVLGPTGPVATEQIEATDAIDAGQLALEFAAQLLDFGDGVAKRANWRVRVADESGEVQAELPIRR